MPLVFSHERAIHVRDEGAGEPVLLLHASSSSGAQWRLLQAELAPRFRTLAVDLLGYGKTSAWNPADELSSADELELLEAVVAQAGGPVHLVGHSYGGLTALKLALDGRVPLRSLTLIEPIAFWLLRLVEDWDLYGEIRGVADRYVAAYRRGDVEAALRPYIDYWNGSGAWAGMPESLREIIRGTAGKTAREWAPAFETDLPLLAIGRLDVPVLVLQGARTRRTTARICTLILDAVAHARGSLIEGAGHMSPLTHGAAVNRAIADHLTQASFPRRNLAA